MQHSSYLESKVLTAPPQRLHLMLIEGAIRFGRQAEEALRRGDEVAAAVPLLRVLDIVGEMLAGVRENKSELNIKIAELYRFMFRRVSEAKINADAAALGEVLRLLEFERQTWQLVCDKLSSGNAAAPPLPTLIGFSSSGQQASKRGFSLASVVRPPSVVRCARHACGSRERCGNGLRTMNNGHSSQLTAHCRLRYHAVIYSSHEEPRS